MPSLSSAISQIKDIVIMDLAGRFEAEMRLEGDFNSTSTGLCGGRRFRRKFSKRDYPLLGTDDAEEAEESKKAIFLSARSKERLPKIMSTTVSAIRTLCFDPRTGKWRWPVNGADLVFPGIYLGDA